MNNIRKNISEFYETDYIDAASYDNLRKIGSVVDGLKNSGRKIVHTMIQKNIKTDIKVTRLQSSISEFTDYLHNEDLLANAISNMGRRYVGTNQVPLIKAEGNFGKRHKPKASAGRYIFSASEAYLTKLFNPYDFKLLKHQTFEGLNIEPRYYVPVLPVILMNGSRDGVTPGYYQNIYPRKVSDIVRITKNFIKTDKVNVPKPSFDGFNGSVEAFKGTKNKWIMKGVWEKVSSFNIRITEIPLGYSLKKYITHLNKLEDNKVINGYINKSSPTKDTFEFNVKVNRKFFADNTNEQITKILGLEKTFVEHFNVMGENNRMLEYTTPNEVFLEYAKIRLDYYTKRKNMRIADITYDIKYHASKYFFIKGVIAESIVIPKRTKEQINKNLDDTKGVIKHEDSYSYLLNMPIISMTDENMEKLLKKINLLKEELEFVKNQTEKEAWLIDIQEFETEFKKAKI